MLLPHYLFNAKNNIFQQFKKQENNIDVNTENKYCETIHIGFVCSGHSSNLYLHTLLKSIYFYRTNPIHLHIIVGTLSKKVLKTLFETWQVPQTNVAFYNMDDFLHHVLWVPNSHYSGTHGLLKLIFPTIIPPNITQKIIILDVDLIFASDIFDFWSLFEKFNTKQFLGIVENQSEYYLGKRTKYHPWPALGKGFNSGVMLYDLKKMKDVNWAAVWTNATKTFAVVYGPTRLGDQDIINSIIKEQPEIIYKLACYWNLQLNERAQNEDCYKHFKVKIAHWNSKKKYNMKYEHFENLAKTFMQYNGNLVRNYLQFCGNRKSSIQNEFEDPCEEFKKQAKKPYRQLSHFKKFKYIPTENDVTFVAQLSFDRLLSVEYLAKFWEGPISLAIYVTDEELLKVEEFLGKSHILKDRLNIGYHAVFKDGEYYPINVLRNVALKNGNTPFVFLADIDFIPMRNLYQILKNNIATYKNLEKKALIIPAFEIIKYHSKIPRNKIDIIKSLRKQIVVPFLSNVWDPGHRPTNYEKWKKQRKPYKIKWQPDFEPYVVVRSDVIQYNEKFVGFGWNKVSHIMELEARKYEFLVLNDVFIIHKPHSPSYEISRYRMSPTYRRCLRILKAEFVRTLEQKYNHSFDQLANLMNISVYSERQKRSAESTTIDYDSTDYYLIFGGPQKYFAKKQNQTNTDVKENTVGYVKDGVPEVQKNASDFENDNNHTAVYLEKNPDVLEGNYDVYYYDVSKEEKRLNNSDDKCKDNLQINNFTIYEDSGEIEWINANITDKN